jgi:hypothetical protein
VEQREAGSGGGSDVGGAHVAAHGFFGGSVEGVRYIGKHGERAEGLDEGRIFHGKVAHQAIVFVAHGLRRSSSSGREKEEL